MKLCTPCTGVVFKVKTLYIRRENNGANNIPPHPNPLPEGRGDGFGSPGGRGDGILGFPEGERTGFGLSRMRKGLLSQKLSLQR